MKLYDNDAYRDEFMELVYSLLSSDGTNDRENQIIDAFDMVPVVEAELLPPNDPLTLEELREMDGEPVWVKFLYNNAPRWMLVNAENDEVRSVYTSTDFECYGEQWLAYRRKLEVD